MQRNWRVVILAYLLGGSLSLSASGRDARTLSLTCNGCHGPAGVSEGVSIPSLAGLDARYLFNTMVQFKEGERNATIMDRIAKGYKVYELRKIAGYFAAKPWRSVPVEVDDLLLERGRALHRQHCQECHEDSGRFQDKEVPRIAGQRPNYLHIQLRLYYDKAEKMPQPSKMAESLAAITQEDLAAMSAFYSSIE